MWSRVLTAASFAHLRRCSYLKPPRFLSHPSVFSRMMSIEPSSTGPSKRVLYDGDFFKSGRMVVWWDMAMRRLASEAEKMKYVQVMVEIRDARLPRTTTHPLFQRWRVNFQCHYIVVYTHEDLVTQEQINQIRLWTMKSLRIPSSQIFFENCTGHDLAHTSALSHIAETIRVLVLQGCGRKAGGKSRRGMVVGVPNVGKSSFVYILTKHMTPHKKKKGMYHAPKVKDFAGETLHIKSHWLWDDPVPIMLVDTPGMFPPAQKLERDQESVYKLAVCNAFNLAEMNEKKTGLTYREVADYLLYRLNQAGLHQYVEFCGLQQPTTDLLELLQHLPKDKTEAARIQRWLDAFNAGKMGPLILDDLDELDRCPEGIYIPEKPPSLEAPPLTKPKGKNPKPVKRQESEPMPKPKPRKRSVDYDLLGEEDSYDEDKIWPDDPKTDFER